MTKSGANSFNPPNLSGAKGLVVDTETTGLSWHKDKVIGYVVATSPVDVFHFPVRYAGGGNLNPNHVEKWIQDILKNPNLKIIGHHLKFDLHMLANHNIVPFGPTECTMVNAALIDENQGQYNLDYVSSLYLDVPRKKINIHNYLAQKFGGTSGPGQMANFHKLRGDDPEVIEYATGDGASTWGVWERQQKQLDEQNLRPVWEVECKVIKVLFKMERRGIRVNEKRLKVVKDQLEKKLHEAQKNLPKNFNVRSTKQIADYLRSCKIEGWPTTEKGNDSFTEVWLNEHPTGHFIIAVRKITNLINSFIDPLFEKHLHDGRVHTTFNQLRQDEFGTVTGRLSSSDPNMQQVPKRDKELAPLFRQIFIPEKEFKWSSNDYSQQEFRVFADYTGSPLLIRGYKADPPLDIHTTVAKLLKVERDPTAKRINLGILYGMGVKKMARALGLSLAEAQRLMDEHNAMIPEARKFLKEAEHWARKRGWVRTKLFRRRRFPDPRFAHKAGNAVIQGTSADMTKLKMVELDEFFEQEKANSYLMLPVHDELNWACAPDEGEIDHMARAIMESFGEKDRIQFSVPMKVDYHLAPNWGKASFPEWKE